MSIVLAGLPAKNPQMTETDLLSWQRKAVFECERDNFINQQLCEVRRNRLRTYRRRRLDAAIDAAISTHGLRLGAGPSSEQAARTRSLNYGDFNLLTEVLDIAYSTAERTIGLNLPNHDQS